MRRRSISMAPSLSSSSSSRLLQIHDALSRFRHTSRVSCSRCRGRNEDCLIEVNSVRCKRCTRDKKKCDLRVTFEEFERMAVEKLELANRMDDAEKELEQAESEAVIAFEKAKLARQKAKHARRLHRTFEKNETDAYIRELASIETMEKIEHGLLQDQSNSEPDAAPSEGQQFSFDDMLGFLTDGNTHNTSWATSPQPWPVSEEILALAC